MEALQKQHPAILATLIGGAAFIIGAVALGVLFIVSKQDVGIITVTGSAKQEVVSDRARWNVVVTRTVFEGELSQGYATTARDLQIVEKFLQSKGFDKQTYTVSPVFSDLIYKNDSSSPREYTLRQTVEVSSDKVAEVTALAKSIQELSSQGVVIQAQPVEYTYSKLADLRVTLLANAMKDARARAEQIAEHGGGAVGKVRSSSSGVVQVLAPNSVTIDDYGAYDTQSLAKSVMVTVRATFELK